MRNVYRTNEEYKMSMIFKHDSKPKSVYKQKPKLKKRSQEVFKKELFGLVRGFCLFLAAPAACGNSQARNQTPATAVTTLSP